MPSCSPDFTCHVWEKASRPYRVVFMGLRRFDEGLTLEMSASLSFFLANMTFYQLTIAWFQISTFGGAGRDRNVLGNRVFLSLYKVNLAEFAHFCIDKCAVAHPCQKSKIFIFKTIIIFLFLSPSSERMTRANARKVISPRWQFGPHHFVFSFPPMRHDSFFRC